jgi:hypothetical protein
MTAARSLSVGYALISCCSCQDNAVLEPQDGSPAIADELFRELADCRQRGIEGLDRQEHNMQPVRAPQLERLAQEYSSATGLLLHGRVARIKYLLRRALESYTHNGNEGDAKLISDLFFGDAVDTVRRSAGELLDLARSTGDSESRFRERRGTAFRGFAGFLVQFVAAAAPPPASHQDSRRAASSRADQSAEDRPAGAGGRTWVSSPLAAVLRFSLEDPETGKLTIDEHMRLIAQNGACWWGWFRAAHDSDHSQALAERLGNSNCEVALWERSEGLCYIARCESVAIGSGIDIPTPDPGLTPAYYGSTLRPAWLQLTAINPAGDRELAERFGDMPTTKATIYWSPEPAREPIVIPARGRSILHLAGLRFGSYHRWATSLSPRRTQITTEEAIDRVLALHHIDAGAIGAVIICGNFVSGEPTQAAYQETLAFVDGLCEQLPSVRRESIVVVPGADDFARPGDRALAAQALYRQFHRNLYGGEREPDLTRLRCYEFADFRLNVLPANSVKMLGTDERDEGMFGQGYDAQLHAMMQDYRRSRAAGRRVINVVAAHHHLIPTLVKLPETATLASVRERLMPGIHDARDLLARLAANRVRLFLHGHLHQPDFIFVSSDDGWQTAVCSAGTAGAAEWWLRTKYRSHHENSIALYDVEDACITGRMISFGEDFHRSSPVKHFRIADQPVQSAE